jgi:hypothetical protein
MTRKRKKPKKTSDPINAIQAIGSFRSGMPIIQNIISDIPSIAGSARIMNPLSNVRDFSF